MRARDIAAAIVMAGSFSLAVGVGGLMFHHKAKAADHLDPPARTTGEGADIASDIADIFVWNDASTVKIILTAAGPQTPGTPPTYDKDVLYQIHISNTGDPTASQFTITARYGKDASGNWGVQFSGIPGSSGPVSGPVQTQLADSAVPAVKAEAGLFTDPFFFDLEGFNDTKSTGILSIRSDRDFFAGKNDTDLIIEFPRSAVQNGTHPINVWGENGRITGT
jgi:hypothetical protein